MQYNTSTYLNDYDDGSIIHAVVSQVYYDDDIVDIVAFGKAINIIRGNDLERVNMTSPSKYKHECK